MKDLSKLLLLLFLGFAFLGPSVQSLAGYKARDWSPGTRETYAARLTSEGVTIAAEPLFTDALAARLFDKKDIVARGIMPLAIVIFNDNDYSIEVDPLSIELVRGDERYRSLMPDEAVSRVYAKEKSMLSGSRAKAVNEEALEDFSAKFLKDDTIPPHGVAAGFIYIRIYNPKDLLDYLSTAAVYIPNIYRGDDGSRMIYFEIDLKTALKVTKQD
jgi:hypothetical protein